MNYPIKITTLNPVSPGLKVKVVVSERELVVLSEGVLNRGGAYRDDIETDADTIVVLLIYNTDGSEAIRCRVPIVALKQMECFMSNPKALTEAEAHKAFRRRYIEMRRRGNTNPDPDDVARAAFM